MSALRSSQSRTSSRSISQAVTEVLESRQLLSVAVGGGWTNAGLTGTYYNNTNLTAPSSFTRKDVRIDFDWGSTTKPGGSIAPGYRDVGTDNYSIQWTGQLIARFSETYTFTGFADDVFILELKAAGSGTWTTVVNQTAYTGANFSGTMALTAGQAYDVRITYKEFTGGAVAQLRWSSPSTPQEVIDPVTQSGINNPDWTAGYTDIVKGARNSWEGVDGNPAPSRDANGWPQGNCSYVFQESLNQGQDTDPLMRGTITFSFAGKADVSLFGNVDYSSLTYSYSSGTNTTTGSFRCINNGSNASTVNFRNTTRTGVVGGPGGFTDFKLMRPTAPDATTSYAGDTTFTQQMRDAMNHFTVIRHQYVANQQKEWSDRTTPTYFNQSGGTRTNPYYGAGDPSDNGASWEYKIMLSNETGRDLMISLPPVASDSYITNLARLIRYGSDANGTPYTTATANPAFPPLNPNLHVYFEIGNELWNWASVFWTDWQNINKLAAADVVANNTNFQQFNYDNLPTTTDGNGNYNSMGTWRFRKVVQRTMQESDIFRSVFGDAAMPNSGNTSARIRPLYEWQYANDNDTARLGLAWADKYYNNGDGVAHVTTPHPINYWLWGGGGAAYYGAINGNGLTNLPADNSFDATTVANGYNQNPGGTGFTFTGTAGIARDAGGSDDIPTPLNGSQVGYITDLGQVSFNFTVPSSQTSGTYGFSFKAVNRTKNGAPSADKENVRVFLDDTIDITAKTYSQGNGYTPPGYDAGNPWRANNVFWTWSDYYFTKSFDLAAGSTHKITIKGMGDISGGGGTNQAILIDDIRITSVDKIFADGIPGGGEATGQPAGQNIQNTMNVEASWAKAFGLEELAYESGWSLGGDDGGSWVQLKAKYGDSRTGPAQTTFMNYFYQSGSAVNVFGTYAQWPSWSDYYAVQGLLNAGAYPIVQGIDDRANHLAAEATNGILGPAVLKPVMANITDNANGTTGQITAAGGFINWTVVVPRSGNYTISLGTTGTGATAVLLANNAQVATGATGGSAISGTVFLTKGNHSIRVRSSSSTSFTVTQVAISGQNAPAAPTLNSATDGDGSASLSWGSVSGATGYVVRYGSVSGNYTSRLDVGNVTSYALPGLTNNQQYFFAVDAYNANGESLPSNEKGVIPLAEGQTGSLTVFEFTGYTGGEASATGSSSSRTPASVLTRGSGWRASDSEWAAGMRANRFASENSSYGANLAAAITNNQYYQFTISPAAGKRMSLSQLAFRAFFQDTAAGAGCGITYSTDGTTFSSGITATGGPAGTPSNPWSVSLSGISALQNTTATVTFRIYQYGMGGYSCVALGDPSGNDVVVTGSFQSIVTAPAAPSGLSATAASSSQINLAWSDNASDETGFTIDRATDAGFTQNLVSATVGANTTSYSATGLSASTTYYFRVKATKTGAPDSAWSNSANATTQGVPTGPAGYTYVCDENQSYNFGSQVVDVAYGASGSFNYLYGRTGTITFNNTTFGDPIVGTFKYGFYKIASPAAPSGLSATAASSSQINLGWTDNASDETGFAIDRATDAGFTQNLVSATVGANTTSYSATGLNASTTYYFRVKATKTGATDSAWSNSANATTQPVSTGIFSSTVDIGGPTPAGSASYNSGNGTYTVSGGGADIWGTSDQFRYLYNAVTGDQTIIARVATVQNTDGWAKAGVMFRGSTAANSMFAAVEMTPSNGVAFQWRTTDGGSCGNVQITGVAAPYWVKLVRSGNTFTASASPDGSAWTQIGTAQTIAMAGSYTAGLSVTAHLQGTLNTSTFTNVSVSAPATSVTLGFNSATPGSYSGAYTESGFQLQENLSDGYLIVGSADGYSSNAYHPNNWAHTTTLTKVGGGTFALTSFKYAAGKFNDAGDIVVTGYKADSTTVTTTVNFSSKTFSTATVNWTNLTRVEFNFANGTNGVYGALDDIIVQ